MLFEECGITGDDWTALFNPIKSITYGCINQLVCDVIMKLTRDILEILIS